MEGVSSGHGRHPDRTGLGHEELIDETGCPGIPGYYHPGCPRLYRRPTNAGGNLNSHHRAYGGNSGVLTVEIAQEVAVGVGNQVAEGEVNVDEHTFRAEKSVMRSAISERPPGPDRPEYPLPHTGQAEHQEKTGARDLGCPERPSGRHSGGRRSPASAGGGAVTHDGLLRRIPSIGPRITLELTYQVVGLEAYATGTPAPGLFCR